MFSIKERDETALSQNNIVVKGFALTLQLVIVEAVPCLNEVVQETCSSSEGDSEEEVDEKSAKPKRKTLSPGHARNVHKRTDVLVRSIIDEDPLRPIEESQLVYSDEEDDEKVDNIVYLINTNFQFTKSMFVRGATKIDVERLRDSENISSKLKKPKKQPALSPSNGSGYIASLVIEKIKPFKEEMVESVRYLVAELTKDEDACPSRIAQKGTKTATRGNANLPGSNVSPDRDANARTIRNILCNLSAYSTPPGSPRLSLGENSSMRNDNEVLNGEVAGDKVNESFALSAHSQNHHRSLDLNQPVGPLIDMPSFSLCLTQDEQLHVIHGITPLEFVGVVSQHTVNVGDNIEDPQQSQKSKRQKHVPQALVDDYECGREIFSRVRKSQKFIFAFDDRNEIDRKYARLLHQVNREGYSMTVFQFFSSSSFIKVAGLAVTAKDILQIAERTRFLTAKTSLKGMYISTINTLLQFSKSRKKESFSFPKGLLQPFADKNFPVNVCKKHWVGICVDHSCGKITVLDSNTTLFSDVMMEKHLYPHLLMLPYLLRLFGQAFGSAEPKSFALERPKGLSQIENPFDCGLMAVLLMSTHTVYCIEACENIDSRILAEEGKSAAIMAFELQESV
ncbi:hypothetical protein Bca52824_001303 [Brassica carinata]|uniref:Ubiquitin-like protease family profile domain-containing protein n=1 Tax=Brassica carinata TaxID=52824 RepID=A0A8X7WFT5_BRACI|nr:hypothetical protein Bca52824_001303 [Brassica carinata]